MLVFADMEGDPKQQENSREELKYYKKFSSYAEIIQDQLEQDRKFMPDSNEEVVEGSYNWYIRQLEINLKNKDRDVDQKLIALWLRFLIHQEEYTRLQKLLTENPNDTESVRKSVMELRKTYDSALHRFRNYPKTLLVDSPQDFEKTKLRLISSEPKAKRRFLGFPDYTAETPTKEIKKLYHFAPDELVESILRQGIIPGFLCGATRNEFVYADIKPDFGWLTPQGLKYERQGKIHDNFALLEIDYTPDITAYMRLEYFTEAEHVGPRIDFCDGIFLSSDFVSLEKQIAIKKHVLKTLGDTHTDWEENEILLDFVPPKNVRVVKP